MPGTANAISIKKRLTRKYLSVLVLLGLLSCTSFSVFMSYFKHIEKDGYLINVSGRQRMLSQRIALLTLERDQETSLTGRQKVQEELNHAIETMEQSHKKILSEKGQIPVFHEVYFGEQSALDKQVNEFLSEFKSSRSFRPTGAVIFNREKVDRLLGSLDHAVSVFEAEGNRHDQLLVWLQRVVLASGLVVLVLSGWLVFRPMTIDITEKTHQLQLERNHVKILLDITVIANRAKTLTDAIQKTLTLICEHTKWPVGHAYVLDKKDPDLLVPTKLWHLQNPDQFHTFKDTTESTPLKKGTGLPGRVFQAQKAIWVRDVTQDQNFPRNKVAANIGVRSAFAFPIVFQDSTVAVLEFFSDQVIHEDQDLLNIVAHVGQQLGQVYERERSDEILRSERDTSEKANQAKSVFLANVSHELRTPMHGILSFARFGQQKFETSTKEKLKSYFDEIYDSGSRLMTLLNDLLDLSKLEAGKITYSMQELDLGEIVQIVISEMAAFARENGLKLETTGDASNVIGTFDGDRIMQVVRNLISNAIKFSEKGTAVQIVLDQDQDKILCQVINHGVGIPKDELESVFDKFVQSSKTRSGAGGTGLGLAICREIVQQHGGRVWAESDLNSETRFIVELPRSAVETKQAAA